MASSVKLPPGFKLENKSPSLPPGFTLEQAMSPNEAINRKNKIFGDASFQERAKTLSISGIPAAIGGVKPGQAIDAYEESAPMIGQIAGSMIPGVNAFGGSVAGATIGQGVRQGMRAARGKGFNAGEIPSEAGRTATIEGIFRGTGKALKPLAGRLMNSVLRPNIRQLTGGKNLGLEAAEAGIFGTKKGILNKSSKMVESGEQELQKILSGSSAKVNLTKAIQELDLLESNAKSIGDEATSNAINQVREGLKSNLGFGSYGDIPIQQANELKRRLYSAMKQSQFGTSEIPGMATARKTAARGIKTAIEQAEPTKPIADINKKIGLGGRVRDAIEKRMAQDQKNSLGGLVDMGLFGGGAFSGNPSAGMAMVLGRHVAGSTPAKSTAAHILAELSKKKLLGRGATIGASEFGRRLAG